MVKALPVVRNHLAQVVACFVHTFTYQPLDEVELPVLNLSAQLAT